MNALNKYSLLLIVIFFALAGYACSGRQTASPTQAPVVPTATTASMDEPEISEEEMPPTVTPTPTPENEEPTETPPPTPEPTLEPTLEPTSEPTPEPTEDTGSGDASQTGGGTDPTPKPDCEEKAAFYADVTVPDDTIFRQDEVFTKIWKVRNEGTCTWGPGYTLVFVGGSQMNGVSGSPLPDAAPGDIIEIPIELTAPLRGGTHVGNWMFSDSLGEWFGVGATRKGEIWVRIAVNFIPPEGTSTGSDAGTSSASSGTESAACGSERNTAYENEVLTLINNARSSSGLSALSRNQELTAAALAHSNDMSCQDFVDHSGSDGTLWFDRISREGYIYTTAKENIYVGNPAFGGTPAGALEWWLNSQIHRENILSDDITEIGIAYVFNANSSYGGYYTTVFARP